MHSPLIPTYLADTPTYVRGQHRLKQSTSDSLCPLENGYSPMAYLSACWLTTLELSLLSGFLDAFLSASPAPLSTVPSRLHGRGLTACSLPWPQVTSSRQVQRASEEQWYAVVSG